MKSPKESYIYDYNEYISKVDIYAPGKIDMIILPIVKNNNKQRVLYDKFEESYLSLVNEFGCLYKYIIEKETPEDISLSIYDLHESLCEFFEFIHKLYTDDLLTTVSMIELKDNIMKDCEILFKFSNKYRFLCQKQYYL
jgi:hypothetical protein